MKCCESPDIIMIGSLDQNVNGDYFEKSYCNNCEAEFLDVWEHAETTMTKPGNDTDIHNSFDLFFDIKTYGELRKKMDTVKHTLKTMNELIETHDIKL